MIAGGAAVQTVFSLPVKKGSEGSDSSEGSSAQPSLLLLSPSIGSGCSQHIAPHAVGRAVMVGTHPEGLLPLCALGIWHMETTSLT